MGVKDQAPFSTGYNNPVRRAFVITPNDNGDLDYVTRAVYVGKTGDIRVCLIDDTVAVTFVGVLAGTLLPIRIKDVLATGTTATDLVGLF